jgi:hypothetical protein
MIGFHQIYQVLQELIKNFGQWNLLSFKQALNFVLAIWTVILLGLFGSIKSTKKLSYPSDPYLHNLRTLICPCCWHYDCEVIISDIIWLSFLYWKNRLLWLNILSTVIHWSIWFFWIQLGNFWCLFSRLCHHWHKAEVQQILTY